jgi:hypothetical protein
VSDTLPHLPKIMLKASVSALAEYATCLHTSIEVRPFRHFAIQSEIGYYSDFMRNRSYDLSTSSMNGIRLGGEVRYYFVHRLRQKVQAFVGLSYVTNLSQIRSTAGALLLQKGKIATVETPIGYQHQRSFYDIVTGVQVFFNKRFFLDTAIGLGTLTCNVSNLQVFDSNAVLFNESYPFQILFASNTLWAQTSHLDQSGFLNLAANIKIGYRLF